MSETLPPAAIEAMARAAGLTMTEVCRRAGLAQSTFTRWKAGKTAPTLEAYRKLLQVVRTPAPTPVARMPLKETCPVPASAPLGLHDSAVPFQYGAAAPSDPQEAEAFHIFARINRELAAEEARADRLMRLYNL
jgi:transcriptional regulator with XRE-family HTH domain